LEGREIFDFCLVCRGSKSLGNTGLSQMEVLQYPEIILKGAPEEVIHCIRQKIELVLLLSQKSFVGFGGYFGEIQSLSARNFRNHL
jgi:hypothetical protein